MPFTLPPLPYAKNALAPHISEETLEYHYGKHHQAYVTNLNKLLEGKPEASKSLEDIILTSEGGIFNNAAQHWNHTFYWHSIKPAGGGLPTGDLADAIKRDFGSVEKVTEELANAATTQFGSGWSWLVQGKDDEARTEGALDHRRLGARLLHRLPKRAAQVRRDLPQVADQLGLRAGEPEEGVGSARGSEGQAQLQRERCVVVRARQPWR
jgi:Fe-Mn family superoxide dismutase